jgi:hypothetical protein
LKEMECFQSTPKILAPSIVLWPLRGGGDGWIRLPRNEFVTDDVVGKKSLFSLPVIEVLSSGWGKVFPPSRQNGDNDPELTGTDTVID